MSRGELPLRGDEPRTFTKGLKKELGPTRGLPPANWGYTHTCHACWWQVWHFMQSNDWGGQVCQGQLSLPSFRGRYMSRGGTLGLPGGNSQALPRALKTWELSQRPGGYYSGTLVTVVTAVLKAVSLSGGHTVAMELPTNMGIKQSSSLTLAMYVCM